MYRQYMHDLKYEGINIFKMVHADHVTNLEDGRRVGDALAAMSVLSWSNLLFRVGRGTQCDLYNNNTVRSQTKISQNSVKYLKYRTDSRPTSRGLDIGVKFDMMIALTMLLVFSRTLRGLYVILNIYIPNDGYPVACHDFVRFYAFYRLLTLRNRPDNYLCAFFSFWFFILSNSVNNCVVFR